jgi:hypothetical protein
MSVDRFPCPHQSVAYRRRPHLQVLIARARPDDTGARFCFVAAGPARLPHGAFALGTNGRQLSTRTAEAVADPINDLGWQLRATSGPRRQALGMSHMGHLQTSFGEARAIHKFTEQSLPRCLRPANALAKRPVLASEITEFGMIYFSTAFA